MAETEHQSEVGAVGLEHNCQAAFRLPLVVSVDKTIGLSSETANSEMAWQVTDRCPGNRATTSPLLPSIPYIPHI